MLSNRIIDAIQGAAVLYAGSRDERLRPAQTFAVGAVVHPDRESVTFFVPESRSEKILSHLKTNGRVALAVILLTHESYQLKGVYMTSRPVDEKERAIQDIYRSKLVAAMMQGGYPEQIAQPLVLGCIYQPAVAITFRVEEIFQQTPGPEAGKKIS